MATTTGLTQSQDMPIKMQQVQNIVCFVFRLFAQIAKRLLLLDTTLLDYKANNAFYSVGTSNQHHVQSSFFNSVCVQKESIERDLREVNNLFFQQKSQAVSIFFEIGKINFEMEQHVITEKKNLSLIHFPTTQNHTALNEMCEVFNRSEAFVNKVNNQKNEVFENMNKAISVMREGFR